MHSAEHYRRQAERARQIAEITHQPDIQAMLRTAAQDYDDIAEDIDSRAIEIRHPTGMAVSETRAALADGDDYREMAERLRGLARLTRSPGIRRELVDLAKRYDRRGDHFDRRPPEGGLFEEVSLSPSPAMMGRHDPSAASL
jgi:hypothetical protein